MSCYSKTGTNNREIFRCFDFCLIYLSRSKNFYFESSGSSLCSEYASVGRRSRWGVQCAHSQEEVQADPPQMFGVL